MKRMLWAACLLACAATSSAQDLGRVLSSTPVIAQVQVPRQVCSTESQQISGQKSGAGAALGAVAGGAVGNSIGHGGGRAAATMLGIVGGLMIGDRVEGPATVQTQNVQRCTTQTMIENRVTAYQVVYEYAGKQYSVQMPYDPGPYVKLQIAPADAVVPAPLSAAPVGIYQTAPAPVIYNQTVYVPTAPIWVAAYPPPYYAYRPSIGFNLQFSNGYHHHGHWR